MASLPDDDGPTMSGLPEPRPDHVPIPRDGAKGALATLDDEEDDEDVDDTTTAHAGPPASQRGPAGHEADDSTVQAKVGAPSTSPSTPKSPSTTRSPSGPPSPPPLTPSSAATTLPEPPMAPPTPSADASSPSTAPSDLVEEDSETVRSELSDDDLEEVREAEQDGVEDSITTMAPRVSSPGLLAALGLPPSLPGTVQIRDPAEAAAGSDAGDEMLDETEIRTMPGHALLELGSAPPGTVPMGPAPSQPPPPVRPAAGRPPSESAVALEPAIDPPTRPGVSGYESPTRPGLPDPETRPRVDAEAEGVAASIGKAKASLGEEIPTAKRIVPLGSYANDEDDEDDESVTTRAPAVPYTAESVTAKGIPSGPGAGALALASSDAELDDGTDGTTQRVRRVRPAAGTSPADGEPESITTQAPGPLTNILRVIASESSADLPNSTLRSPVDDDDEEPVQNQTAVMVNAPLKQIIAELASSPRLPAIRPTGGPMLHGPVGSAARQLEPSSASGLRVAGEGEGAVERASLGTLGLADARTSGIVANAMASDGSASAPIDMRALGGGEHAYPTVQPSVHDVDLGKGPRYGLLVGIVAVVSVVVPVTLFVALHRDAPSSTVAPTEPASEIESSGPLRAKAPRTKGGAFVVPSASAAASASAPPSASASPSASGSAKTAPKGFPIRR